MRLYHGSIANIDSALSVHSVPPNGGSFCLVGKKNYNDTLEIKRF